MSLTDPETFVRHLIEGTQFENDAAIQEHLAAFGHSFKDVVNSSEGRQMMERAKTLALDITNEAKFWTVVKVCWK